MGAPGGVAQHVAGGASDEGPEAREEEPVAPARRAGGRGADGLRSVPAARALARGGRGRKVIVVAQGGPPSSSSSGSIEAAQVPAVGPVAGAIVVASQVPVIRFC